MICSLFNFCPFCSVQSPRGGGFGGLSPPNTIKSVAVLSIFRMSSHSRTNAKPAYRKPFSDGSESAAYSSFVHKKPNLTQMKQEFKYLKVRSGTASPKFWVGQNV